MTRHMGLGLHVLSKCFFNNQEMCVLARWTVQTYPVVIFFLTQHKLYANRVCNVRRGENGLLCMMRRDEFP
jgi:hypothetical protein